MTSEPRRLLLLGTIDPLGRVTPRPVLALADPLSGEILSWSYLESHEPHSTTPCRALLRLPSLTLCSLKA